MNQLVIAITLLISLISRIHAQQNTAPTSSTALPPMRLTTTAFSDGGIIPVKFSQAAPNAAPGGGTSPALSWSDVPPGTQSFVLHMHDVDVSRNKTTDDNLHWLVWNIPATATSLPEGVPAGAQLADGSFQMNVFMAGYRGPGAAASGPLHHYVFELYALDIKLDVKPSSGGSETRVAVLKAIDGHVLGKAGYVGLFKRPQ
ncbi:YbhB/YbcL family Raf kinase inhibitor-like protein [Spirosoma sp. BT702]|uniref:YbhB/YbcL family Raf kinase inhibitor-like protein n=1 Tax=Spirosoma profusum TaxID=2771354 RepID=A0A927AV59_9BACT|nr:YbhB/YbcL family Raf kinase inhibitor-like protein [Spirosoma profusum]MBD2704981.1 YbhB/YbcL family Raf kinase inhibitor-like protein [Spirosoma profusum]